jgi:hypothetical protein
VVFNRDERLTRGPAVAPVLKRFGPRRAVLPIDSDAAGTWIAGSDLGAVFALLNVTTHLQRGALSHRETRGGIITALLDAESLDAAFARMQRLEQRRYAPFRLLCLSPTRVCETWSDGWTLRIRQSRLQTPLMRTSSSLGDRVVANRRIQLFERHFARRPIRVADQDAFHHHQWHGRPEFSVLMSRADARTVSITTAAVDDEHVTLSYVPLRQSMLFRPRRRARYHAGMTQTAAVQRPEG